MFLLFTMYGLHLFSDKMNSICWRMMASQTRLKFYTALDSYFQRENHEKPIS